MNVPFLNRFLAICLYSLTLLSINAQDQVSSFRDCFLREADKIKSFDVYFSLSLFSYNLKNNESAGSNADAAMFMSSFTNRDVFAKGFGRRFEWTPVGKGRISIKNWRTATSSGRLLGFEFQLSQPGYTYLDYIDPTFDGYFLSDLLKDEKSRFTDLGERDLQGRVVGFRIQHPSVRYTLDVWFDPSHNYMMKRLECYINIPTIGLFRNWQLDVNDYISTNGLCFPSKGTRTDYSQMENSAVVVPCSKCIVELVPSHTHFNSINSDAYFSDSSVSDLNWSFNGWKMHETPEAIKSAKADPFMRGKPIMSATRKILFTCLFLGFVLGVPVILYTIKKRG